MGMAASQVRFLQLTSRKNDIGCQLSRLANSKITLTRDMQRISRDYQNALNQKVLKWSNNSGASYVDLSYQNLMRPSNMNLNKPYLLTDNNNRVVIDSQYQKYAAMISANGAPSGNWEGVRSQVLSELTGIDKTKIDNAGTYKEAVADNEQLINQLIEKEPQKPTKTGNLSSFIQKLGTTTGTVTTNAWGEILPVFTKGTDWASAYSQGGSINLGNGSIALGNLTNAVNTIYNTLSKYLDDPENLKSACNTFLTTQQGILQDPTSEGNKQSLESDQTPLSGNATKGYTINVKQMIDTIMGSYAQLNGCIERGGANNEYQYTWNDIDNPKYKEWETAHAEWQTQYDKAKADYNTSVSANNELMNADEEALIEFYDAIFSSIAENGWTYNNEVNNTEYLNQMLQNNMYTLTTVDRDSEYNTESGKYEWDNEYKTDIASNFTNIFTVSDSDAREEALVKYEHEKSIINEKESRIDTQMKNLETEQAAINNMLESLDKQKNDNIERTMGWSA